MAQQPKSAATPPHGPARPRPSAPGTPAPCPRMVPLATPAHARVPPRATVATAAEGLTAALSGASGVDTRRPGDGICVRRFGRRWSVTCVSGVGGSGVPRAPHGKVGGARQRAIGRSRACATRKICGQRAPHMGGPQAAGEGGGGGSSGGGDARHAGGACAAVGDGADAIGGTCRARTGCCQRAAGVARGRLRADWARKMEVGGRWRTKIDVEKYH